MTAFATVTDVTATWRPLTTAENAWAGILLDAAAAWIRGRKPGILDSDPGARIVSIDVVRIALQRNKFEAQASGSKILGPRQEIWSAADAGDLDKMLDFTDYHIQLLGLWKPTGPKFVFGNYTDINSTVQLDPIKIIHPDWDNL